MLPLIRPRHLVAAAALCSAFTAKAEVMLSNLAAPPAVGQGNRTWAAEWTQYGGYHDVSIVANLFGVGRPGVSAHAWLSTAIGPGATVADLIASADVDSQTVFTDLDLGPDTYYLVVQVQSGSRAAGWRLTGSFDAVSAHDVERGASFSTAFVDFPAFGPAGSFNVLPLRLQFALNGTPDAVAAVPEPTPAALLGVGLVGLWVSRRAKPGRGLAQYFKRA